MKKFLTLLLTGVLTISLIGCAKDEPSSTEKNTATAVQTETKKTTKKKDSKTTDATDKKDEEPPMPPAEYDRDCFYDIEGLSLKEGHHYVGITCDGGSKQRWTKIYDLDVGDINNESALVWRVEESGAGIKFRHSNHFDTDVLLTCTGKTATMIDLKTKKVLYTTPYCGENCHSIELLPNDLLLVTATTGERLSVFDTTKKSAFPLYKVDLHMDGHGCLYDPDTETVWIAGASHLCNYRVTHTEAKRIRSFPMPAASVHDLAPVYGKNGYVWITCAKGVYSISLRSGAADQTYPQASVIGSKSYTPGFGNWPDGSYVCTWPDGSLEEWNTQTINFLKAEKDGTYKPLQKQLKKTDEHYYKCRVLCIDYD